MASYRLVGRFHAVLRVHRCARALKSLQTTFGNHSLASGRLSINAGSFKRWQSTATTEEGNSETEEKSWFVRWLHGEIPEEKMATEEEINERRTLLTQVQEMYFSNPPKAPGLDFYKKAVGLLIKYNDRVGVENLYEVMKEEKIPADDQLIEQIESFILKAREEAWYK